MRPIRVRFAPSPTGNLHVGSARTAIFNWLFARHHGGTFILRIEDTDQLRSEDQYTKAILDGMRWLGMDWDEGPDAGGACGPYFQSGRLALYQDALRRLQEEGKAYPCFCSSERLESVRQQQLAAKINPRYDRTCLHLPAAEVAARLAAGEPHALRIRVDESQAVEWEDLCKGKISIGADMLDDNVVAKSDGFPTYNFAVVVDDVHMQISHVIRGEDHVSNTPKQILIYRALGAPLPAFAHIPMILGPDRSKMSKRHGATNVIDYERMGFLPEAFFNFLTLLGWAPADGQEIFSLQGLVQAFDLDRVVSHAAIFDIEKLKWMNLQYIKSLSAEELLRRCTPFLEAIPGYPGIYSKENLLSLVTLFRERMNLLAEITQLAAYFFQDPATYDEKGIKNTQKTPDVEAVLLDLTAGLQALSVYDHDGIEGVVRDLATRRSLGAGKIIHPARLAVSGRADGPGLFELMQVLGKETCLRRLTLFLERKPWQV